ncbi:MAG: uracil-DNA glycosylase [Chloroflexi bacterium]|nr:uracil-DNA glycosylase [Chloroflexota bacterium]
MNSSPAEIQLRELAERVRRCTLCQLARSRTHAVPGEGPANAEVMFIGEGPGYHEDQQGRPFVGAAGKFLEELLASVGLRRSDVYIANVVKCRPPQNRDPLPEEVAACAPYLDEQIAMIDPLVVVTLGRYSMAKFFAGEKISRIHGTARVVGGRTVVAFYHPAAALHQQALRATIEADFRRLPGYIVEARERRSRLQTERGVEEAKQASVEQLRLF